MWTEPITFIIAHPVTGKLGWLPVSEVVPVAGNLIMFAFDSQRVNRGICSDIAGCPGRCAIRVTMTVVC